MAAKASFEKVCPACQKTYYSENAYENHIKSQRHRMRVASLAQDGMSTENGETASVMSSTISLGEPINVPPVPEPIAISPPNSSIDPEAEEEFSKVVNGIKETKITDEPVSRRPTRPHHSATEQRAEHPLSPEKSRDITELPQDSTQSTDTTTSSCLFCNIVSDSLDHNIQHMTKAHGLFIPERVYLIDLEGLIGWLYDRIHDEPHECLYCHRTKNTAEAVQDHMKDLGHCKIGFEDEVDMIEVGQFYDFSSTYSDDEDVNGGEDETMSNDEGWEDDSSVASDGLNEEIEEGGAALPKKHLPKSDSQRKDHALVLDDELYLPSGKVAGHRSLAKYYRQNLRDHPSPLERQKLLEATQARRDEDVVMENSGQDIARNEHTPRGRQVVSRANGGLGMLGVTDAKKREIQAVEKRETKRAQRAEKQYQWNVDKKGNSQKHFRDPLLQ